MSTSIVGQPKPVIFMLTSAVDDCWSVKSGRDPNTKRIIPDSAKFPDGISGVASKIHDLGLKVGIYSSKLTGYYYQIGMRLIR